MGRLAFLTLTSDLFTRFASRLPPTGACRFMDRGLTRPSSTSSDHHNRTASSSELPSRSEPPSLRLPEPRPSRKRGIDEVSDSDPSYDVLKRPHYEDDDENDSIHSSDRPVPREAMLMSANMRTHAPYPSERSSYDHHHSHVPRGPTGPRLPPISTAPHDGSPIQHRPRPPSGTLGPIEPTITTTPFALYKPADQPRTIPPSRPNPLDRHPSTSSVSPQNPIQLPIPGYRTTQQPTGPHPQNTRLSPTPPYVYQPPRHDPHMTPTYPQYAQAAGNVHAMARYGTDSPTSASNSAGRNGRPQCWDHGCNGRTFSTFSNLLRHQRERSGVSQKSYCPRCGAEFTRSTAKKNHLENGKCRPRRNSGPD